MIRLSPRLMLPATALALASTLAVPAAQAQALPVALVQCTGSISLTFSPGLTDVPQQTTINTTSALSCTQLLPLPLSITQASSQATNVRPGNDCTELFKTAQGTSTYTWNNGQTSRLSFTSVVEKINGTIVSTSTGTVTEGRYLGQSILMTNIWTPLLGGQPLDVVTACSSPGGLTQLSGVVNLVIGQVNLP